MHSLGEPEVSGGSQGTEPGPSGAFGFGEESAQQESSAPHAGQAARKRRGSRAAGAANSDEQEAKLRRQQMLNKAAQQRCGRDRCCSLPCAQRGVSCTSESKCMLGCRVSSS